MSTGVTPVLGLLLGTDADENDNWQKLDRIYRALFKDIIPSGLVIQGDLEVAGNVKADGALQVLGPTSLATLSVASASTFLGAVGVEGALIIPNGPITLPPGAITPAALAPGAATTGVWIGTAQTVGMTIQPDGALVELASVATDVNEDPARWSLVLAQVTLRMEWGAATASPSAVITLTIRRGTTDVQQRVFNYDASSAPGDGLNFEMPYTLIRLAKPGDTSNIWRVMASHVHPFGGAFFDIARMFAQVHVVQFR